MSNLNRIVYLAEEDLTTLFTSGSVTKNDSTIAYNENDLYITPTSNATDFLLSTNNSSSTSLTAISKKKTLENGQFFIYYPNYSIPAGNQTLTLTLSTGLTTAAIPIMTTNTIQSHTPVSAGHPFYLLYYDSAFYVIGNTEPVVETLISGDEYSLDFAY